MHSQIMVPLFFNASTGFQLRDADVQRFREHPEMLTLPPVSIVMRLH